MSEAPYWVKIRGISRSAFKTYTAQDGGRVPATAAEGTGDHVEVLLASEQGAISVRIKRVDGVEWVTVTLVDWPDGGGGKRVLDAPIADR